MSYTNIARVVAWMVGTLLSFSMMAVAVRELAGALNVFEILVFRSASGLLIVLVLALVRPELRSQLATRQIKMHLLRNTTHFAGQYAWALGITLLPLATVFAIEFTTPVWVALLAVFFLGERMTASRAATIVLGFVGVLVILRPGLEAFQPATLIVLGCALGLAVAGIATKRLTATETTLCILFWMNLMQLPMNLAGCDPGFLGKLTADMAWPILGICVAGFTGHFCLANAFRHGDAIMVVPLDFLRIPLIAAVGYLFYREPIDGFVFAGAGIIVAGILWNLRDEARKPQLIGNAA